MINALRDERDQAVLAQRLASEVALSDILGKALMLNRMLITGSRESNVAANNLAVEQTTTQSEVLQKEIDNLKMELDLRRDLANNSPMAIIERGKTRAENSRTIYQAAPESDRLQQLQKPAGRE